MGAPTDPTAGQAEPACGTLALRTSWRGGLHVFIPGAPLCFIAFLSLLAVLFAPHSPFPSVNGRTRGLVGRGLGREVAKDLPFGLSLSSLSFSFQSYF